MQLSLVAHITVAVAYINIMLCYSCLFRMDGGGMSGMGGGGGGMKGPGGMNFMTADGSDLSLGGHTKDLILLELKHLTDELVHLNRGGAEGGGRDMKGG